MTCQNVLHRLDAHHAGTLAAAEREALEAHLITCDGCRAEFRFARALRSRVADLPAEIRPGRDLWAGIEGRIRAGRSAGRPARPAGRRPGWLLAAAAVFLMLLGAAVTLVVVRPRERSTAGAPAGARSGDLLVTEAAYREAAEDLAAILEQRRAGLSPRTIEVVERNLRIIDEAIQETRAALAADPGNPAVAGLLWATYEKKLDLLRRAADNAES